MIFGVTKNSDAIARKRTADGATTKTANDERMIVGVTKNSDAIARKRTADGATTKIADDEKTTLAGADELVEPGRAVFAPAPRWAFHSD
ncbi:MAG: hypothetical protein WBO09_06040 [Methylocystis silviterrae]|uniref:hypothetical protein n=1 Tax=Methylocystis silviterrae TaxID=2743612 RepID=UPI003C74087F